MEMGTIKPTAHYMQKLLWNGSQPPPKKKKITEKRLGLVSDFLEKKKNTTIKILKNHTSTFTNFNLWRPPLKWKTNIKQSVSEEEFLVFSVHMFNLELVPRIYLRISYNLLIKKKK